MPLNLWFNNTNSRIWGQTTKNFLRSSSFHYTPWIRHNIECCIILTSFITKNCLILCSQEEDSTHIYTFTQDLLHWLPVSFYSCYYYYDHDTFYITYKPLLNVFEVCRNQKEEGSWWWNICCLYVQYPFDILIIGDGCYVECIHFNT